jgi:hypothetical protein
VGRVGV